MMNKIKMTSGKARKILYGFYNKDCYYNTPLYEAIPFILKENKDLQQKINKAVAKLYCWGEVLDPNFQKEILEILGDVDDE